MMRSFVVVLCLLALVSPWVIYRRNQKKRLICKEEPLPANGTLTEDSVEEQPMVTSQREKRDVEIDAFHRQPIIRLGTKSNSSTFIDDGDFDIVSDHLTPEEIKEVKQRIMDTCNALNSQH